MTAPRRESQIANVPREDKLWVSAQYMLLLIVLFGGPIEWLIMGHGLWLPAFLSAVIGVVVIGLGLLVLNSAARTLSSNLTPYPTPVEGGSLVDTGLYSLVRHPIYFGLLVGTLGYALLFGSRLVLVVLLIFIPFFLAKAIREERLLSEHYAEYSDYKSRVPRRLIPYIL